MAKSEISVVDDCVVVPAYVPPVMQQVLDIDLDSPVPNCGAALRWLAANDYVGFHRTKEQPVYATQKGKQWAKSIGLRG